MRFIALAIIFAMLPIFISVLKSSPQYRNHFIMALGGMMFVGGSLQIDAALVTWPFWTGTVKGIQISLIDMVAIALIATRRGGVKKLPFLWLIPLYLVPVALSIIPSSVATASLFTCIQLLRGLLLFIAIGGELHRLVALRSLLWGLSLGLMLQAGYVMYQKLSGMVQATGTMAHQNLLGVMTELALIPLIAALLEGERHILVKLGTLAGLIVVAGGGSRGAMALVGVGIVVLALLSLIRNRSPHKLKMIGLGVMVMAVMTPLAMMTLKERFGNIPITAEEEQRAAMERAAKAMSADHFFGVGANLYANVSNLGGYAEKAGVAWNKANRSVPVHNGFLLARAETGFFGEVALIALFVFPVATGLRHAFRYRRSFDGAVMLGSAVTLGTVAVHSTYEFSIHVYHAQMLMFMNIAIIAGGIRRAHFEKGRQMRKRLEVRRQRTEIESSDGRAENPWPSHGPAVARN